jgi:hypothetical protein
MALISTDRGRVSNWLKHVYDYSSGYCFETLAKSAVPAGAVSGSVLDNAGALVTVATTANAAYVLVDDLNDPETAMKTRVLVLARGPAKVARQALTFGADVDTDAEKDAVLAVLAGKGILADKQF